MGGRGSAGGGGSGGINIFGGKNPLLIESEKLGAKIKFDDNFWDDQNYFTNGMIPEKGKEYILTPENYKRAKENGIVFYDGIARESRVTDYDNDLEITKIDFDKKLRRHGYYKGNDYKKEYDGLQMHSGLIVQTINGKTKVSTFNLNIDKAVKIKGDTFHIKEQLKEMGFNKWDGEGWNRGSK